jgi:hypothetical protein
MLSLVADQGDVIRSEVSRLQLHQIGSRIRKNSDQATSTVLKSHDFSYVKFRTAILLPCSVGGALLRGAAGWIFDGGRMPVGSRSRGRELD